MKNAIKLSLIAAIIIALGIGTLYVLDYFRLAKDKNPANLTQQKPDEIVITDLPTGEKLVENKTGGFSVKVPNAWQIQKPTTSQEPTMFYSPKSIQSKEIICKIESYVNNEKIENVEKLKKERDDSIKEWETVIKSEYSSLVINGYSALKHFLETDTNTISREAIIMTPNKTYGFVVYDLSTDKDKCYKEVEFDKFLETVSIK